MNTVSDISQLLTIMRYEILKVTRGRKLYIMLAIIAIIAAAVIIVPPAAGETYPDKEGLIDFMVTFVEIIIILLVTLFGADSIVYDFEKGTAFVLYPNPVRRRTIFIGKFLSSTLVSILLLVFYYVIMVLVDIGINGGVPGRTVYSLGVAIVYMVTLMAITMLISTSMKSTLASSVIVFAMFFLIFPMVNAIMTIVGQAPWFIITSMETVMADVLVHPYPQTSLLDMGTIKILNYHPSVTTGFIVMAAYAIPALALAYRMFMKKELQ